MNSKNKSLVIILIVLTLAVTACTGNFFLDDDVLREEGVTDFDRYAVTPGEPLLPDFFVDE